MESPTSLVMTPPVGADSGMAAWKVLLTEAIAVQRRTASLSDASAEAFKLARDAITEQIKQGHPLAELFGAMGQIYTQYHHDPVAAGYYLLAASLDPDNPEFQIALGTALLVTQQYCTALQCFRRAVRLNPTSSSARQGILKVCSRLGITSLNDDPVQKLPRVARWRTRSEQSSAPPTLFLTSNILENHYLIGSFEQFSGRNFCALDLHALGEMIGSCNNLFLFQFAKDMGVGYVFMELVQLTRREFDPRPETLYMIREATGASVGVVLTDSVKPIATLLAHLYRTAIDFVVTLDAPLDPAIARAGKGLSVLDLWAPPNPAHFYQSEVPRGVDVCFVGRTKLHYEYRQQVLSYLRDRGINVTIAGLDENNWLNPADYGDLMRRSKIVINFSRGMVRSPWDREALDVRLFYAHQTKARVFEALSCGALLLEEDNSLIRRYFEPNVHYLPFANQQQLYLLVTKYLDDDTARTTIANAGHERAKSEFGADKFWRTILECAEQFRSQRRKL